MKFPALPLRSLARRTVPLLFIFLISTIVFLGLTKTSFAQAGETIRSQQNASDMTTNTNPDVPNNLHNWTQTVLIEVISATSCTISGMDPTNPSQPCLGIDQKTNKIGFMQNGGGAIGIMASSLSTVFTPPLHTSDYLSYLSKNFGLTKTSYAAGAPWLGTGFTQLSPVMNLWVAFRNITYAFFVIIFLVIGIAIMLRVRIDPRTVMTIQNQIPKIIIGIVLVTFSFAIAGFLIDMMWTTMYVSYTTLSAVPDATGKPIGLGGLDPASMQGNTPMGIMDSFTAASGAKGTFGISNQIAISLQDVFRKSLGINYCKNSSGSEAWDVGTCVIDNLNPLSMVGNVFSDVTAISDSPANVLFDLISLTTGATMFFKVFSAITGATAGILEGLGNLFGGTGAIVAGSLTGGIVYGLTEYTLRNFAPWLIVFLIINLAIFVSLIRLWFELIKAYIFILFDIILAPFWIMAGLIPGNTAINFSSWLKDLVANLAAFPAVAAMFMLGSIIMTGFKSASHPFVPPLVGNPGDTNFLSSLIGLSIILSTPTVVSMVKKAIKAPNIGLGAIAQGISGGTSLITGGAKSVGRTFMKTPEMGKRGGLGAMVRGLGGF